MLTCVDKDTKATALIIVCNGGLPGFRSDDWDEPDDIEGMETAAEALIDAGV